MNLQFELFPDFPRLDSPKPYDLTCPDRSEAWKLFDYPTEDDEPMAQSKKQADTIIYLTSIFEAVLVSMQKDYFIGADVFVYHTQTTRIREAGKVMIEDKQRVNSPDVFFAVGEGLQQMEDTNSFILEDVKKQMNGITPRMVSVEILSKSNYKDKQDQRKRFKFQNELGVDEYIVVHTKPKMSLEVYWRLNGTLERILFCDDDVYDFVMLGVKLVVKTTPNPVRKGRKPTFKYDLLVYDSEGALFNNYGTEREIRQKAEEKLAIIATNLREEKEERLAAEEEYLVAEEARLQTVEKLKEAQEEFVTSEEARVQAEEKLTETEKQLKKEKQARLRAEEQAREEAIALEEQEAEMNKLLFQLEEAKRLLELQKTM